MSRRANVLLAVVAVALCAPAASSAWQYTFQNFFDWRGHAFGAGRATATKCHGGMLGTYDYRSGVVASGDSFELEFDVRAKLSVRDSWHKLKQVEVDYTATNYPQDIAEEAAMALDDFHETVYTKYKADRNGPGGKLLVRHGELVMFGNVVVESDESKTKFKPKPGC